ncbi:MAG: ABC transporter ATP-binding protein [Armatimonadota bacterium]|nr:ABC transporter ATP-binding protein [Armatimonadota bacterium]MDR7518144.1 ABC transporter ATP-binding protein [Armatimonadota bacterium]MDR7550289.1 ABC transporter ATP-binding protein [Armatimonadota bacterium]
MLEVRDIHTYYGQSHVLHGVSLALQDGQVAAVVGRNGMGKTTLIRSIAGLTPPRRGSILFQGREISGLPPHTIARMGMALVPQGRRVFPSLSVEENLLVGARRPGRWSLGSVYRLFGRLAERRHHRGHQLSGGEQQMLSIGRALMTNPHLLLLDEPSEGLAPLLVEEVAGVLTELKRLELAAVLVEQNLPLALRVADVVYVLSKGQVVFTGTPDALRADREILGRHLALETETRST